LKIAIAGRFKRIAWPKAGQSIRARKNRSNQRSSGDVEAGEERGVDAVAFAALALEVIAAHAVLGLDRCALRSMATGVFRLKVTGSTAARQFISGLMV
jgi:hypothetical protein